MMMAHGNWKQEYQLLKDFIASHPEIVITTNEISIPQTLRDEFYRRFDDARRAVVEDHCSALPPEIELLSENYGRMEKEIKDILGLEDISMPTDLLIFLRDPKEGLTRSIYNRMFELLQGKMAFEDFETMADEDLSTAAATLFRLGYERWATLALIKQLDPDEAYRVALDEDDKPILGELKTLCFGRQAHHATMRIPEFVLHSRRIGKYVAFKMPLAREIDGYVVPIKPRVRPRNRTGDTSQALDTRAMLLSFLSDPREIPIFAEIFECTRTSPEWLIEYIGYEDLSNPQSLDSMHQHIEAMNPTQGAGLILVGSGGELEREKIPGPLYAVAAGFDQSRLESFINACFCAKKPSEELFPESPNS
jgi:hypothetical protein